MFKLKLNLNGEISKGRSWLFKSLHLWLGFFFRKLVTRLETMRLNVGVACGINWPLYHLDVNSTFVNDPLEELVYVTRPQGFEIKGKEDMAFMLC